MRPGIDILLVEDNPGDVRLAARALAATASRLHPVANGEDALRFLRGEPPFEGAPRPDLVLLDLQLPRRTGHEVLADLKQDAALRTIPVIVLTSSSSDDDVRRAYGLHANGYVTKSADVQQLTAALRAIEAFWNGIATLPPRGPAGKPAR